MSRRRPFDWQRDDEAEAIVSRGADYVRAVLARIRNFYRALSDAGVHVGIGTPPACATCEVPWPCSHARER